MNLRLSIEVNQLYLYIEVPCSGHQKKLIYVYIRFFTSETKQAYMSGYSIIPL